MTSASLDSSEVWNGTSWMAGPTLPAISYKGCVGDRGEGKIFYQPGLVMNSGTTCKTENYDSLHVF